MSTHIKIIKGRHEVKHIGDFKTIYGKSEMHLTRFSGGKKKGAMIQITIEPENGTNFGYIQLTQKQVKKLAKVLTECYNYDLYPSE